MDNKKNSVVKLKESELVKMIDKIVNEAVTEKKKEWITEQASKNDSATLLESKINELEKKVASLITIKK